MTAAFVYEHDYGCVCKVMAFYALKEFAQRSTGKVRAKEHIYMKRKK